MYLNRIIHPVGQGAFFTEEIILDDFTYTMVYDCGSSSHKKLLKNEIKRRFKKNQVINVLFISHFHHDHINGLALLLDYCKVENVYIPQVSDTVIQIMSQIAHHDGEVEFEEFLSSPQRFVRSRSQASNLIIVDPMDLPYDDEDFYNENQWNDRREQEIQFSREKIDVTVPDTGDQPSGAARDTSAYTNKTIWNYMPINIENKVLKNTITKFLEEKNINLNNINYKELLILKEAFNQSVSNTYSLVVYSGSDDYAEYGAWRTSEDNELLSLLKNNLRYLRRDCCLFYCLTSKELARIHDFTTTCNPSCLYLGDANLNYKPLRKHLLACRVIHDLFSLQVPHHGSNDSFNGKIINFLKNLRVCFVSYGTNNNYGHPSYQVESLLSRQDIMLHHINESSSSGLFLRYKRIR